MSVQEIALASQAGALMDSSAFMPVMDVKQAIQRRDQIVAFVKGIMVNDEDFGTIPGTTKPTLYKPGAEKLQSFFGLEPEFQTVEEVTDWTGAGHNGEAFFYVKYRCILKRGVRFVGYGEGSCNSWESKYRYRWVPEDQLPFGIDKTGLQQQDGTRRHVEFDFAIRAAETTGKYGKPADYWERFQAAIKDGSAVRGEKEMKNGKKGVTYTLAIGARLFRVPNPDIADVVNTVQKMAHKRAHVAAILNGTGASQFFTQDMEDFKNSEGDPIDTGGHKPGTQEAQDHVRDTKVANARKAQEPAGEQLSPVVQQLYAVLGTSKKTLMAGLTQMKKNAFEDTGSNDIFNLILLNNGMEELADVGLTVEKARKIGREILEAVDAQVAQSDGDINDANEAA